MGSCRGRHPGSTGNIFIFIDSFFICIEISNWILIFFPYETLDRSYHYHAGVEQGQIEVMDIRVPRVIFSHLCIRQPGLSGTLGVKRKPVTKQTERASEWVSERARDRPTGFQHSRPPWWAGWPAGSAGWGRGRWVVGSAPPSSTPHWETGLGSGWGKERVCMWTATTQDILLYQNKTILIIFIFKLPNNLTKNLNPIQCKWIPYFLCIHKWKRNVNQHHFIRGLCFRSICCSLVDNIKTVDFNAAWNIMAICKTGQSVNKDIIIVLFNESFHLTVTVWISFLSLRHLKSLLVQ